MFSEVCEVALQTFALRGQGFSRIAEQIEHLPLSELKKRKLDIALLVCFFVLLVEIGEPGDEEDAWVGGQTDRCL